MIKSIELRNWKTHADTKIEFRKGTNVLVGIMGAGKSSVMDAISFALFGTFPALKQKRVSLDDVITNRPEEKKSAQVVLDFEVGGNSYTITRRIERNAGSSAALDKNGKPLQTQPERVNEEIEKALGLNYDIFSRAIYAEQNRLDYILELRKGDRKKQIDEMLNLDKFAKAEENATSLINSIKSAIADEAQMVESIDVGAAKKQLDGLANERKKTEENIKELEIIKAEREKRVNAQRSELEAGKKEYERRKALSDTISKSSGRISTLKAEIEKINAMHIDAKSVGAEIDKVEKEVSALSDELELASKEEREIERRQGEIGSRISQHEKRLAEKQALLKKVTGKDLNAIAKVVDDASKELKETLGSLAAAKSRKAEEEKWLAELSKHIGTCPICRRELDEELKKKLLVERKEEIDKLGRSIAELERRREVLEEEVEEKTKERTNVQSILDRLKDYEGIEDELKKEKEQEVLEKKRSEAAAGKVEELKKRLDVKRKEYNEIKLRLDYMHRMEAYGKELEEEEGRLRKADAELKSIRVDEKTLYALQDALAKESAGLSEATSKLQGERKYLETVLRQIDEKTTELGKFEAMKERIETRRLMVADLNKFKSSLIDTEALLRNSLVQSVNALLQGIWPKIYPYGDFTSLRLSAEKDDYVLEVNAPSNEADNWIGVEGVASGGERSITALALRIALSMVIVPNLKWLILDEPTHNLDRAGIAKLIEVLGNTLPGVVEQVFIITHDESLKDINPASVYILDRDKAAGGATVVGEIS